MNSNNNNNNNNHGYMSGNRPEQTSLNDYINLAKLNLMPIVFICLTALVISIIYAMNAVDIYKSTTVLKISQPQGNILDAPLLPGVQDFGSDRFISNEIEILESFRVRERVAKALIDTFRTLNDTSKFSLILAEEEKDGKTVRTLRSDVDIAGLLKEKVNIEQKKGIDIVEITAESPSPFEAALISNDYAKAYTNINLGYNRQQLVSVKDFLAKQKDEKLNQLVSAEETLKNYQESKGIVQLPDQAKALIDQLTDFESKKNATKIDLTISEKTLNQYKSELAKQDPNMRDYLESFAAEPYIKSLQTKIAEQQTQKDLALSNINSQRRNEVLTEFDNKINDLKEKLNNQIAVYKAGVLASSPDEIKDLTKKILEEQVKYESLLASYKKLSEIVEDYQRKMNELPTSAIELTRLKRQEDANEKLYLLVEEKYQEALINEQSTPGNVLIVDDALIPKIPAKPNRVLIIIVGFLAGLGLGFGFAFLRTYLDNTVKTPEDIQNKGINFLAWIPPIEGSYSGKKEFEFIVAKKPDATASEAFRALRTRIKFSKISKEGIQVILITSSAPQEGKTTVSVNLAGSFGLANSRTILIDCDLRKPRLHTIFDQQRYPGFTDYFFGQCTFEEVVRKSELNNLDYVTAGTIPPNPSEILGSSQMEAFIAKLRKEYDYIIIDSPPLIAVTDSEILSRYVDATALVVSASKTPMDLAQKSVELLTHDEGTFIGVILNNFSYRSGYSSYYKYYYYYSRPTNGQKQTKIKV